MGKLINVRFVGKGAALRALAAVKEAVTRQSVLQEIAEEAVALIKARTLDGLDERDRPLQVSKRADREGGQTLSDKGHMLGSMRVLSVSPKKATIGFGDAIQGWKAWWAQDGTKPHDIFAKPGGVLAFKASLSTANSIVNTRGGVRKARRLTMANARANGQGMTLAQHVHHPGTPKRPFFGISPRDESALQLVADEYVARALKAAGA